MFKLLKELVGTVDEAGLAFALSDDSFGKDLMIVS